MFESGGLEIQDSCAAGRRCNASKHRSVGTLKCELVRAIVAGNRALDHMTWERTKNILAPRLRSLSVAFSPDLVEDETVLDSSDSTIHFYRSWPLPNLRRLEAYNLVPVPFIAPSLTSLSIELRHTKMMKTNDHIASVICSIYSLPGRPQFTSRWT